MEKTALVDGLEACFVRRVCHRDENCCCLGGKNTNEERVLALGFQISRSRWIMFVCRAGAAEKSLHTIVFKLCRRARPAQPQPLDRPGQGSRGTYLY
jgi:hypothetical protein